MSTSGVFTRRRLDSVDFLRGAIMIVMALDHTRDFFSVAAPITGTLPLFLTRWITHFCAPVFFLLTGTSARLSLARKGRRGLSRYLLTRGLWIGFLEVVVVRCLAYQFNVDFRVTMLLDLWALGWAMVLLAALVWLPDTALIAIGVAMIGGHNLLDGVRSAQPLWVVLHQPGFLLNSTAHTVFVAYPLIPWVGVTILGFVLGRTYEWVGTLRQALLFPLGCVMSLLFLVGRWVDVYGEPVKWRHMGTASQTLISFLNVTKQPPSLLFLLMTLGPALIVLSIADHKTPRWLQPAVTIGRVPLFYYIGHFFLIHAAAVATSLVINGRAHWLFESPDLGHYPFTQPPGWGVSLPTVYLIWLAVVCAMYPACRWFAALKQRRRDWWLSYL